MKIYKKYLISLLSLFFISAIPVENVGHQYKLDFDLQAEYPNEAVCYIETNQIADLSVDDNSNTCNSYTIQAVSETGGVCTLGGGGSGSSTSYLEVESLGTVFSVDLTTQNVWVSTGVDVPSTEVESMFIRIPGNLAFTSPPISLDRLRALVPATIGGVPDNTADAMWISLSGGVADDGLTFPLVIGRTSGGEILLANPSATNPASNFEFLAFKAPQGPEGPQGPAGTSGLVVRSGANVWSETDSSGNIVINAADSAKGFALTTIGNHPTNTNQIGVNRQIGYGDFNDDVFEENGIVAVNANSQGTLLNYMQLADRWFYPRKIKIGQYELEIPLNLSIQNLGEVTIGGITSDLNRIVISVNLVKTNLGTGTLSSFNDIWQSGDVKSFNILTSGNDWLVKLSTGGGTQPPGPTQIPTGTTLPLAADSTTKDTFLLNEDGVLTLWQYTGPQDYNDTITANTDRRIDANLEKQTTSDSDTNTFRLNMNLASDNLYIYLVYKVLGNSPNNINTHINVQDFALGSYIIRRRFLITTGVEDTAYRNWYSIQSSDRFNHGAAVANGNLVVFAQDSAGPQLWVLGASGISSVIPITALTSIVDDVDTPVAVASETNGSIMGHSANSLTYLHYGNPRRIYEITFTISGAVSLNGTANLIRQTGQFSDSKFFTFRNDDYLYVSGDGRTYPAYDPNTAGVPSVPARDFQIGGLLGSGNRTNPYSVISNGILYTVKFASTGSLTAIDTNYGDILAFNISTAGWQLVQEGLSFPESSHSFVGSGVPDNSLGSDGQTYVDSASIDVSANTVDLYVKVSGSWRKSGGSGSGSGGSGSYPPRGDTFPASPQIGNEFYFTLDIVGSITYPASASDYSDVDSPNNSDNTNYGIEAHGNKIYLADDDDGVIYHSDTLNPTGESNWSNSIVLHTDNDNIEGMSIYKAKFYIYDGTDNLIYISSNLTPASDADWSTAITQFTTRVFDLDVHDDKYWITTSTQIFVSNNLNIISTNNWKSIKRHTAISGPRGLNIFRNRIAILSTGDDKVYISNNLTPTSNADWSTTFSAPALTHTGANQALGFKIRNNEVYTRSQATNQIKKASITVVEEQPTGKYWYSGLGWTRTSPWSVASVSDSDSAVAGTGFTAYFGWKAGSLGTNADLSIYTPITAPTNKLQLHTPYRNSIFSDEHLFFAIPSGIDDVTQIILSHINQLGGFTKVDNFDTVDEIPYKAWVSNQQLELEGGVSFRFVQGADVGGGFSSPALTDLNFIWLADTTKETTYSAALSHTSGSGVLAKIEDINIGTYGINQADATAENLGDWVIDGAFEAATSNPFFIYSFSATGFSLAGLGSDWNTFRDWKLALRSSIQIVMRNSIGIIRSFPLSEATRTGSGQYTYPTDTSTYFTGAGVDVAVIDSSNISIVLAWTIFEEHDKPKMCVAEKEDQELPDAA